MTTTVTFAVVTLATVALAALRRPGRSLRSGSALVQPAGPIAPHAPRPAQAHAPAWLRQALVEMRLPIDATTAWLIARWAAVAAVALAAAAGGVALAVVVGIAMLAIPPVVRRLATRRSADRRDAQLPQALERLASGVRSGSSLTHAFAAVAHSTPEPLGCELRSTAVEVEHGAGLGAALDRWSARPDSGSEVCLAAAALGLAADGGGEVARSVDRVAATLRERRELRAEVRALATQARASAGVLAAAPLAFTALVSSIEPAVTTFLLTSPVGLACLAAGLGLDALGAAWMARILRSVA